MPELDPSCLTHGYLTMAQDIAHVADATGAAVSPAAILVRLLRTEGQTVPSLDLADTLEAVLDKPCDDPSLRVRKAVKRLRAALRASGQPWRVETVHGIGYRVVSECGGARTV